jgi:hypothetical protein
MFDLAQTAEQVDLANALTKEFKSKLTLIL